MITSFDTDDILFKVLSASAGLKAAISGGIYPETERPDNSEQEDITVNTITITRTYTPQTGTSNVNIYVPDLKLKIKGQEQRKENRERLREITNKVISILEAARVEGLAFWITNETVLNEPKIYQHYTNLRIDWNIQLQTI
ncbi:MAG: hypothetical protein EZS26_000732 [Candidatus Ordinivivax streblomastigis]|uniref:Uncharacterized protein n=1 Tax=Candidatus Ordinivivax streblomastigis TaxID=2540710 RepID=A0A5M8P3S2_9BACT|nr:MAG: hypothetical protein EZS26_000732 [Candidatus Ordinivivax streblomastigis]